MSNVSKRNIKNMVGKQKIGNSLFSIGNKLVIIK